MKWHFIHPGWWLSTNRRLLSLLGFIMILAAVFCRIQAVEPKPFFATERDSRARAVPGVKASRVSLGDKRPPNVVKRDFKGEKPLPPNEALGLREVSKGTTLNFRTFGTRGKGGAIAAPGTSRR